MAVLRSYVCVCVLEATFSLVLMSGMSLVGGLVLIAIRLYLGSPLSGHGGQLEEELELVGGFVAWGHA